MATPSVSRDFDTLSSVYDETRQPLDPATTQGLFGFLGEHKWHSILEVGVGTGRIARPLVDLGIRLVGVDASRGMLGRAAAKHLPYWSEGTLTDCRFRTACSTLRSSSTFFTYWTVPGTASAKRPGSVGTGSSDSSTSLHRKRTGRRRPAEEEPRRIVREDPRGGQGTPTSFAAALERRSRRYFGRILPPNFAC